MRFVSVPVLFATVALGGCDRSAFDVSTPSAFEESCIAGAETAAASAGVSRATAAGVFGFFLAEVRVPDIARRFDPSRPPDVAGSDVMVARDVTAECRGLSPSASRFAGVSPATAFGAGLSRWTAALETQSASAETMRKVIRGAVQGKRTLEGRVADLIGRFSPRGTGFSVIRRGARSVPAIVIEAVNPLDEPIDAFFFAVDLRRPNDSLVASGRFTFKPPAPLAPGVQAVYTIEIGSVPGFAGSDLLDVRDNVVVKVRTEDVVSGGRRLLAETIADPSDSPRIEALGVLRGRIEDFRDRLRRMRERLS